MAFFGIWLAEGWTSGKNIVSVCQKKSQTTSEINELLESMSIRYTKYVDKTGKTTFTIRNKEMHEYLSELGYSYEKYIPQDIKALSPKLLDIMFEWMLKGDGRNRKKYKKLLDTDTVIHRELYTTSKKLAEDASEIIMKIGSSSTITTRVQKDRIIEGRQIKAENSRILYVVSEGTACNAYLDKRFIKVNIQQHDGKVYCVTTGNGTWMMRRNGKIAWTKNCDHPDDSVINLRNVSHMVTKIWWDGDSVMGKVKLLDTPSGNILKSLIKSGVKLGISSRGLGSTRRENGKTIVESDFQLICFDFVQEPSTPGAFMMKENKNRDFNKILSKNDKLNRLLSDITKD
jgi:hypothetical protein